jgi:hypothetical protein
MGLLDDAIREHLELKRRRGADPDEVARQADEALGDPRRGGVAPTAEAAEPAAPAAVPEPEPVAEAEIPAPATEPEPAPPAEPEPAPPAEEAAPPAPPAPRDEPWLEDDDRPDRALHQPTAEFTPPDVEPEHEVVHPDEEPPVDEDVLEETPDFLQETPEHDRLWFEQKPPRDFDFDS